MLSHDDFLPLTVTNGQIQKKEGWMKMENQKQLIAVDEFSGKYKINEYYRPIAATLQKKFTELAYVPVNSILFIENLDDKKKHNDKAVFAQISKMPGKWEDIIFQITGRYFEYILEIFRENNRTMTREQIVALLYHELKHIQLIKGDTGPRVGIVGHDVEDWVNMIQKLGSNWATTKGPIPDLLDDGVQWENIEGPATLFPAETILRLVK